MPTPEIDLDPFKAEMQNRIAAGESQKDVRRWLAAKGVQIHRNTLSTRLQEWQWTPTQVQVPSIDATLVAEVDSAFHTTHHDDQTIADNIAASGIPTTHRQVKRIRLTHGWRRRGDTGVELIIIRNCTPSNSFRFYLFLTAHLAQCRIISTPSKLVL